MPGFKEQIKETYFSMVVNTKRASRQAIIFLVLVTLTTALFYTLLRSEKEEQGRQPLCQTTLESS